jgi:predicted transposase YdaD
MEYDASYKELFSHPEMVADLLAGFVLEPWVQEVDFTTLEKVGGSYVSDDLRTREDDLVWRVRLRGGWLYVYLLLEFQSSVEPYMAVRVMTYVGLLYQDLIRRRELAPGGRLPPVVPVVLYNGLPRWQAAVDIAELVAAGPGGLAQYRPRLRYLAVDQDSASSMADLEGVRIMLAERVVEWTKEWKQLGFEEGQRVGLQQGQIISIRECVLSALEIRFGHAPMAVQEAVSRTEDLTQLRALLRRAILAASLEEFAAGLDGGNGHHKGAQ